MRGLEGRVAVVTGAAGGMGAAAAIRLGEEKVKVAVLDIKDCSEVVNAINTAGGEAFAWNCDTTNEAQLADTMKAVAERFGGINILVNNAGLLSPRIPFMEWETKEVERFMDVNYMGYVKTTRAAFNYIKAGGNGRIINVASRTTFAGAPGQFPYTASKGAIQGLTWTLAKELGVDDITVNAVMPGQVATPGTMPHSDEEAFNRTMQNQSIKKRVYPEHMAALVAFMASDDAAMISGQSIVCDGGGLLR
jgi:NAD(P)-dependent dehydrogenase (short-subunit alcohol dehydrogenase family)